MVYIYLIKQKYISILLKHDDIIYNTFNFNIKLEKINKLTKHKNENRYI